MLTELQVPGDVARGGLGPKVERPTLIDSGSNKDWVNRRSFTRQRTRLTCEPTLAKITWPIGQIHRCFAHSAFAGGCPQMPLQANGTPLPTSETPMQTLQRIRIQAFHAQGGRCYYCQLPMWIASPPSLPAAGGVKRLTSQALRCTAEHLIAKCDGGRDQAANIVAVCEFCNRRRHRRKCALPAERFRELVSRRMAIGKWHGLSPAVQLQCRQNVQPHPRPNGSRAGRLATTPLPAALTRP